MEANPYQPPTARNGETENARAGKPSLSVHQMHKMGSMLVTYYPMFLMAIGLITIPLLVVVRLIKILVLQ